MIGSLISDIGQPTNKFYPPTPLPSKKVVHHLHEQLLQKGSYILFLRTLCAYSTGKPCGTYAPSIIARKNRLKLANILNLARKTV